MDMALTHTINAFSLPLVVLAVGFFAAKGWLRLSGRSTPVQRSDASPATSQTRNTSWPTSRSSSPTAEGADAS